VFFKRKKPKLTPEQQQKLEEARQKAYFQAELEKAKKQGKNDSQTLLDKLGNLGNFDFNLLNEKTDQMTHFLAGDTFTASKNKKDEKNE
jgi:hypothetical protein